MMLIRRLSCWKQCGATSSFAGTFIHGGSNRLFGSSLTHALNADNFVTSTLQHDTTSLLSSKLHNKGYALTPHRLLTPEACQRVRDQMPKLFRGVFETGIYPDEWHWREGISRDDAAREICNSWKSDRTIASIVLNEDLGRFVAEMMGWDSVRIGQDDLVWKPPSAVANATVDTKRRQGRIDTVGFHQDSTYISAQFEPYERNSITVWMALDDTDTENGCLEYAVGSHEWSPILHLTKEVEKDTCDSVSTDREISSFHSSDETSYRDGLLAAAALAGVADPLNNIEAVPAKEGHAILHHQDVFHGSGPNRSPVRHRRALVAHYIRGDVSFVQNVGNETGPFGQSSYIYGRYKRYDCVELDDSFFPIVYGDSKGNSTRTPWIDEFVAA